MLLAGGRIRRGLAASATGLMTVLPSGIAPRFLEPRCGRTPKPALQPAQVASIGCGNQAAVVT
jgi:hypothetical protein